MKKEQQKWEEPEKKRNKGRTDKWNRKRKGKWNKSLSASSLKQDENILINACQPLTGSRRSSSVSRRAALGFSCTSSLHSLSEAGGDSARSVKSSLVLGPRKRILSRRFSMVNTAHLGFTLTWRTATLQGQTNRKKTLVYSQKDSVYLLVMGKKCWHIPLTVKLAGVSESLCNCVALLACAAFVVMVEMDSWVKTSL